MTADPIVLEVLGVPASQGSKTRMPNGAMVDGTSPKARASLQEWRRAVADQARLWLADHPGNSAIDEPSKIEITFRFTATKSDPYRALHAVMPDGSKVLRSTEDALVDAGLLADDRILCDIHVRKRWCDHGETAGATVTITPLGPLEAHLRERRKQAAADRRRAGRSAAEQQELVPT